MGNVKLVKYDRTYFVLSKKWLSDTETNALTAVGDLPSDDAREKWYDSLPSRKDYLIFGVEFDNKPIGVCGVRHIDNGAGEWFMYIGEKAYWGRGIGGEIIKTIQKTAKEHGVNKLNMRVLEDNKRCIKLHEKHSFNTDGRDGEFLLMSKTI